ncbi:hypothetical protein ACTXG7_07060 [Mycolicibacterium sp. Dal123E01]|uniref:hypothetical protein n=1 Tax=Mycolicibacterium sp. Dal123E01 TaxID=3457578 RepID=UPI00403EDAF9
MTNRLAALIAAPAIAGAILGGAALGFAGPASAQNTYNTLNESSNNYDGVNYGNFNSPTTYADPAPEVLPYGVWVNLH